VLQPAFWAAAESGRVSLGPGRRSWFGFTASKPFNSLTIPTTLEDGTLDAFLGGAAWHSFLSFSCVLLSPLNLSFASVEGETRRMNSLSKHAEPSSQLLRAQYENDFGDGESFGEGVSERYVMGVLDSILQTGDFSQSAEAQFQNHFHIVGRQEERVRRRVEKSH
jgi:hypothetical protein